MKQLRKKKTAKKVWILLAIFIVPPFILWGSGSLIRSKQGPNFAGKLFNRNISFPDYENAYLAVRNEAMLMLGDNFTTLEKSLNLKQQAWDRLILLYEAKRLRIKVSDKEVVEALQKYPFFQKNGQFDKKLYEDILNFYFRIQPIIFEEQMRESLMLRKLYEQVTSKGSTPEEKEKSFAAFLDDLKKKANLKDNINISKDEIHEKQ